MRDVLTAYLALTLPVITLAVAWSAWHVTAWALDARRVMREARRWGQ